MEEKKEQPKEPIDLTLQQALTENINLAKNLKNIADLKYPIILFLMFAIIIMVLMLLKVYQVV